MLYLNIKFFVIKNTSRSDSSIRSFIYSFIIFILTASAWLPCYAVLPTQNTTTYSLAPMLKQVLPGVVNIAAHGEILTIPDPFPKKRPKNSNEDADNQEPTGPQKFDSFGSGVIINADHGYILTNAHLVKDTQIIMVTLSDSRRLRAKVIGFDIPSDIAIIQINTKYLTAIPLGDSDKLKVGDFVAAIGNPFGLQQTVTSGVVSGLERANLGIEGYESFIQTDAPINPGNSGGALVNMQGELIGINTAILSSGASGANIGIGFAIPSNMAKSVMEQLIQYGKVERGMLGVIVQNITPALSGAMNLKNSDGALVSQVLPSSPAEKAGLKAKDIILRLNGKPIHSSVQVSNNISLLRVGSTVELDLQRDGKTFSVKATITDPSKIKSAATENTKQLLSGLQLRNFNQLINNKQEQGVEVLYVEDTCIGFSSGLRPGDLIVSAANQPIHNIEELQKIAATNTQRLLLEIKHGMNGNFFLVLEE